jgi:hypothetical protein
MEVIMTDKPDDPTKPTITPDDAKDLENLWMDTGLGDGITDVTHHSVANDKPKNFFRTVPDPAYRRWTEIYTHKPEGVIDTQHYIIAPAMRGKIEEARPCMLVTVVYRDGAPRIWPIKFPKSGMPDNEAWVSARRAAKLAMVKWVRLIWVRRAYDTRDAPSGYAPDPDYSKPPFKLPPFNELVRLAFGEHGIIRGEHHPIYRELFGTSDETGGDGLGDDDNADDF